MQVFIIVNKFIENMILKAKIKYHFLRKLFIEFIIFFI